MSEEYGSRGEQGDAERDDGPIEFDRLFSCLSTARRRYALYCIVETPATALSTTELVNELAALERRVSDEIPPRDEIELSLRHTHLPKLSSAGVIDYDPERSVVSYCGGRRADRWLARTMDAELDRPMD
ncbi:hypothetical protein ACFQDG_07930 [Natronoarchaeum mannanilyticum]|uniref:DUF7344 domain-containing protein n=1 Tax=Natronoarchaeum mannanilyticum TaxID=926360 RepID=A0AAV3TCK6_9EURY